MESEGSKATALVETTAHSSAHKPVQASSSPLCASLQTHSVHSANEEVVIEPLSTSEGSPNEYMLPSLFIGYITSDTVNTFLDILADKIAWSIPHNAELHLPHFTKAQVYNVYVQYFTRLYPTPASYS